MPATRHQAACCAVHVRRTTTTARAWFSGFTDRRQAESAPRPGQVHCFFRVCVRIESICSSTAAQLQQPPRSRARGHLSHPRSGLSVGRLQNGAGGHRKSWSVVLSRGLELRGTAWWFIGLWQWGFRLRGGCFVAAGSTVSRRRMRCIAVLEAPCSRIQISPSPIVVKSSHLTRILLLGCRGPAIRITWPSLRAPFSVPLTTPHSPSCMQQKVEENGINSCPSSHLLGASPDRGGCVVLGHPPPTRATPFVGCQSGKPPQLKPNSTAGVRRAFRI